MNFKLLRLQYKFLIQLAGFLVYMALLALILLFTRNRLSDSHNIEFKFQDVRNLASQINYTANAFLLHTDQNNTFHQSGQNDQTIIIQALLSGMNDTIQFLMADPLLKKKVTVRVAADSLFSCLNSYTLTFNQLQLLIKELGSRNSGEIKAFTNNSQALTVMISGLNISGMSDWMMQFAKYEPEFLFLSDKTAAYELESMLESLSYHPALASADPMVVVEINTLAGTCLSQLRNLKDLQERIGSHTDETGLINTITQKYDTLGNSINALEIAVQKVYIGHKSFLIILVAIIILLFTFLYIYQLVLFFRSIKQPLSESVDFSISLSKGKNPDKELNQEVTYEFSLLNSSLNALNKSLNEKRLFVEDLLKQKFKADLNLQGKLDTFGKTLLALKENMRKTREEQTRHAEENQVRRYQNEGIAKFADILRSNSDNLNKLADVFIREIVRYLDAIQGGLFLLNKVDDDELYLAAAFAYNRKKYLNKNIRLGESLVGTCAVERKTIRLTNIPEDYIEITSGLGDAPPKNLLLLPVMHEDHLVGVLEIASLTEFDDNQLSLGEKIASSLASTIINARINSQTSELLQKSQQQAAEMVEQEEEMRQNMEELKATQEESARREDELEGILRAIDQAFYVIEYDTHGTILKVNQRLLFLINMHADKVIGKNHIQIFGKKSKADSLLFANVAEGNTVELAERVVVNQITLDIKNTFTPIRSKDGLTIRILNIMNINI
jgi:PAS domain-containing protein